MQGGPHPAEPASHVPLGQASRARHCWGEAITDFCGKWKQVAEGAQSVIRRVARRRAERQEVGEIRRLHDARTPGGQVPEARRAKDSEWARAVANAVGSGRNTGNKTLAGQRAIAWLRQPKGCLFFTIFRPPTFVESVRRDVGALAACANRLSGEGERKRERKERKEEKRAPRPCIISSMRMTLAVGPAPPAYGAGAGAAGGVTRARSQNAQPLRWKMGRAFEGNEGTHSSSPRTNRSRTVADRAAPAAARGRSDRPVVVPPLAGYGDATLVAAGRP